MEKKNYQKPSMKVLELRHKNHLLIGSGSMSRGFGGGWNNEE